MVEITDKRRIPVEMRDGKLVQVFTDADGRILAVAEPDMASMSPLEWIQAMAARQTCEEDTRTDEQGHHWDSGPHCVCHDWGADQDTISARAFLAARGASKVG